MRYRLTRRGGRAMVLAASLLPGVAAAQPVATASAKTIRQTVVNQTVSGSLAIAWTGEPARGCAAAGLCGVGGAMQITPSGSTGEGGTGITPATVPIQVQGTAVARVLSTEPDGAAGPSCADPVSVDLSLLVRRTSAGLRAVDDPSQTFGTASAGRCAGPTAADLTGLQLPATHLGAYGYVLSGTTSYGAGPFLITVVSTLRARITVGGGFPGEPTTTTAPVVHIRHVLQEDASVRYRVVGTSGALRTTFTGLAAPLCAPLGACGASGSVRQTFAAGGSLSFSGQRQVSARVGRSTALADLSAGRLTANGGGTIPIAIGETWSSPQQVSCLDRSGGTVQLTASTLSHRRGVEVVADAGLGEGFSPGVFDPFRTRCPGPSSVDVLGSRESLATAVIAGGRIGAPRLTLTLRQTGAFTGSAYDGSRSGSVTLTLSRTHESGGTARGTIESIVKDGRRS